jgi:glycosyltransferase involved in cell wall biosynthesis
MFCTVIIPTIGRATLSRSIDSVLGQDFSGEGYEVVVVNDSGESLSEADWINSERVTVLATNRRERSVARNTGAAIARGDYLCFLDDDDWLLPGALYHFWTLAKQSDRASWLCGGIRVVDEFGEMLGEVNSQLDGNCLSQVMGGAWAPIQASLVLAEDFFKVGGYDLAITGTEDLDLCRRIALCGEFASTAATVACLFRGREWDTSTDYLRAPEDTVYSRDKVLDQPGALKRMIKSADSSYWHGRTLRVYASTARYHWRRRRWTAVMSRIVSGAVGVAAAGRHLLSREFWRAAGVDHPPQTLHHIMLKADSRNG